MAIQFHKKFIGAVAAISILVTGVSASQADAGSRDTERALAAILGLAVIGAIVAENRKDDRREKEAVTRNHRPVIQARPLPRDVQRKNNRRVLPQACLQSVETRRGNARYLGQRCLERNYRHVNSLPQNCQRRINTNHGSRNGYAFQCLRQNGYTLARR
ncbi:MAG: hypothetical protein ABJL99_05520 [Aliishimia sp.]